MPFAAAVIFAIVIWAVLALIAEKPWILLIVAAVIIGLIIAAIVIISSVM